MDISSTGTILFGGRYTSLAKISHNKSNKNTLQPINLDIHEEKPNIGLWLLPDGDMLYNDGLSHDLVKLDSKMKEIDRLKGTPLPPSYLETAFSFNQSRRTFFTDEEDQILWLNGISGLSIVDSDKFKVIEDIPNFWKDTNGPCFAMSAVATRDMAKIVGFGYSNARHYSLHLYYRKNKKFLSQNFSKLLGDTIPKCLEISHDQNILFLGGAAPDPQQPGRLLAFGLKDRIEKISELRVGGEDCGVVSGLRRHPRGNILFVGGYCIVSIVFYGNNKFEELYIIREGIRDEVVDLRYIEPNLYIVSPAHDFLLEINFTEKDEKKKNEGGEYMIRINKNPINKEKKKNINFLSIPPKLLSAFSEYKLLKMTLDEKCHFMQISRSGLVIYLGCQDFLHVCEADSKNKGLFLTNDFQESAYSFCHFKEINLKFLAYTAEANNWFQLRDFELEEQARLKTKSWLKIDKKLKKLASMGSDGHDKNIYLWNRGDGTLGIIDLKKMEYEIIPELGAASGEQSLAHGMLSARNGRKILTLTTTKGKENSFYINYWQKGREKITTKPVEFLKESCNNSIIYSKRY